MQQKKIHSLFPTPLLMIQEIELAKKMLPIAKEYLQKEELLTFKWNYKNTYNPTIGLERFDDFYEFNNYICNIGIKFLNEIGYDYKTQLKPTIFASEMVKGDSHQFHAHPNCVLSGVFYLQVPENSSPIIFKDPRPFRNIIDFQVKEENQFAVPYPQIQPEAGMFLVWQSWLEHCVPLNHSIDGRITLVFNLYQ